MQLHKKTVYIREEDLELWAACPNKSLMVHNALSPYGTLKEAGEPVELEVTGLPDLTKKPRGSYKLPEGLVKKDTTFERPPVEWCKHGMVKGFCKQGCK